MQKFSYHRRPDRSTTSRPVDLDAAVQTLRNDNVSGSQAITRRAAALVEAYLAGASSGPRDPGPHHDPLTRRDVEARLLELGRALVSAHPAMAPLYNLFESLLESLDDVAAAEDARSRIQRAAAVFVDGMDEHNRAIAGRFCNILDNGREIFTHSAGSTVRTALLHCWQAGRGLKVHCTESRPAAEGSALARDLAEQGIPATLSTDSLAFSLLRQAPRPVLVVGADAVTPHGIVNKAGTLGLATAARSWGIPLYVLAGSEKFLPSASPQFHQQDRPVEEVLPQAPEGLRVINRYFDLTPLEYVTGIITERGMLTAREATLDLAGMKIRSRLGPAGRV